MKTKAQNAAQQVFGFIFDMQSGKPCGRSWQQEHGGTIGVGMFFHPDDCHVGQPADPHLVMGTAEDWHRMGLQIVRQRTRKGGQHGRTHSFGKV